IATTECGASTSRFGSARRVSKTFARSLAVSIAGPSRSTKRFLGIDPDPRQSSQTSRPPSNAFRLRYPVAAFAFQNAAFDFSFRNFSVSRAEKLDRWVREPYTPSVDNSMYSSLLHKKQNQSETRVRLIR